MITGIVVNYNTPELLERAVNSIREHYDFEIIIIDGSEIPVETDETVYHFRHNIGHGKGLNIGITLADTDKVLLFDTDIELKTPCIEKMLELFDDETYGVGEVNLVEGSAWGYEGRIPCLHPYFQIISKKWYNSFMPYVHSGAPTILTSLQLHTRGESWRLKNFPVKDYITHHHNQTLQKIDAEKHYKNQILARDYF